MFTLSLECAAHDGYCVQLAVSVHIINYKRNGKVSLSEI